MNFKRLVKTLFFFSLCYSFVACTEEPSSWTFEKIVNLKEISDLQLSPDNKKVAFVVKVSLLDQGKDSYFSRVYIGQTDGEIKYQLLWESDHDSTQPKWSPDGRWISFLSTNNDVKNLFMISAEGGDVIALTKMPNNIETYRWSPDSKQIVFMMPENFQRDPSETSYIYKMEQSINRLWIIDIGGLQTKARPITNNDYYVRAASEFGETFPEYDWSPDGKTIVFAYSEGSGCGHHYHASSIASIDLASGNITPWKKKELHESLPIYSPDGKWVAYLTSPGKLTLSRKIAVRSACGKEFKLLPTTDDGGIFFWGPSLLGWSADGKHLLFFEPKGTKFHLMFVPFDGGDRYAMTFCDHLLTLPSLSHDRKMMAFVRSSAMEPEEAFVSNLDCFAPIQVSNLNQGMLDLPIPQTERFHWNSKDGLKIEGLITYPIGYQKGKKYPLLVDIHGGPMGFFMEHFIGLPLPYPHVKFAEAGYIIFRPNPRGSSGYGIEFREANIGDFGGRDYLDIMTGVEALVQAGIVDKERMGVMGWSYGGYMTAWIIGQNNSFKAASVGAGMSNFMSYDGTTDSHYFVKDYFLGSSLDKEALCRERSPIYYAKNVTTPCLIQHGMLDKRVPVSQGYEYYHALSEKEKTVKMYLYPNMKHFPVTPKTQIDVMRTVYDWFTEHLKEI